MDLQNWGCGDLEILKCGVLRSGGLAILVRQSLQIQLVKRAERSKFWASLVNHGERHLPRLELELELGLELKLVL